MKRIFLFIAFFTLVFLTGRYVTSVLACDECGSWSNWFDTSSCIASECGTSEGTKTQEKNLTDWVCDKDCPEYTFSASQCPSENSAYTGNYHHNWCAKKINGHWKYAPKLTFSITFKYEKSSDPNKCHKPSDDTLGIPSWARDEYGREVPEWKNVVDSNCRCEIVDTQSRTVSCSNAPVIDCGEPTITPTPTEPQPTPEEQPRGGNGGSGQVGAPVCNDTVPPTPSIVSVVRVGGGSVKVTWTKVDPASDYAIMYGRSSGDYPYSVFSTGNTDNFLINGISSGCFAVKAINGCMPGPLSSEYCNAASGGQVLGASTMAETGSAFEHLASILFALGSVAFFVGVKKVFQKKAL